MPGELSAGAARFRDDLAALIGPLGARRLAIAVSGGPDSMALLALAVAAAPGQVIAATVDHRLRPGSGDEAAMVAAWCADAAVPHAILVAAAGPAPGENLHDWARALRYRLLRDWALSSGAALLATAHHADDQAETFLMRATRGAGVAGLAGIRACWRLGDGDGDGEGEGAGAALLVRPLLGWRRAELRALAIAAALPFVDDPGNADPRFDRTRFRALIEATPLLDPAQLARAAAHAAEADAALAALEAMFWARRTETQAGALTLDIADLPRELRRRLARAGIAEVRRLSVITRPDFTPASNVEPLLDALEAGTAATQAGVLVRPAGTLWRFTPAPPRRTP